MPKRLLDVGNCGPDHGAVTDVVQTAFDATVVQAHGMQDAITALEGGSFDLVTVNRIMDRDGASGLEIIQKIKADKRFAAVPVMLITNYPEYQSQALAVGAVRGFGKNDLRSADTVELLRPFLS